MMQSACNGWFGVRVDLIAFILMIVLTVLCVIARDYPSVDKLVLSVLLPSILTIQDNLIWSLKTFMNLHATMVASERCMNLKNVPKENFLENERPPLKLLPELA